MKTIHKTLLFGIALWSTVPVLGDTAPKVLLAPQSSLSLTGDSTLHPYTSRTETLMQEISLDAAALSKQATVWEAVLKSGALKDLVLKIPVTTLKSKESGLDKNMYRSLKATEFPEISFRLAGYEVFPSTSSPNAAQITATGSLTVAGKEQPITMTIVAVPESADLLNVKGNTTLMMSQYGIKPPSLMLGTIKVKDRVDIQFDLHWTLIH